MVVAIVPIPRLNGQAELQRGEGLRVGRREPIQIGGGGALWTSIVVQRRAAKEFQHKSKGGPKNRWRGGCLLSRSSTKNEVSQNPLESIPHQK
jgi:hypothetical protein